ncbi:endonuclease domain-containing protein [Sphingomonas bacterium]|uniref:endonuclease domain-containing protein n=1 Tax=Sphingomonas bacterium TaxID=1895847 RepID=UPI00157748B3|nr:endonuclease domain-containing protein [Sphingomonas bacterium]
MGKPTFKIRDTPRAKALRNSATPAERRLWLRLKSRQVDGCKFSRQMPVGPYFADLLCRENKLIVEVDGYSHDVRQRQDEERTERLEEAGFRVLRFANADVMANIEGVVLAIAEALRGGAPHPRPLPQAGGEMRIALPDSP